MLSLCLLLALQDPSDLVDQLRSDRIEQRDLATREFLKLGPKASPAIEALLSDPDPEVVLRARQILRELSMEAPRKARLRLEETLTRATSVHLRFTSTGPGAGAAASGEVWVKRDKVWGRIGRGPGPTLLGITSDGRRVRVERCTTAPREFEAAEGQGRDLLIGVARWGAQLSLHGISERRSLGDLRVTGEALPGPRMLRHFRYGKCGDVLVDDLTLSETGLPVKRVLSFDGRECESETYEFTLNEDIPDGMFSLEGK